MCSPMSSKNSLKKPVTCHSDGKMSRRTGDRDTQRRWNGKYTEVKQKNEQKSTKIGEETERKH